MNKFLNAAKRDGLGVLRLYWHLFFRHKWYKTSHADLGHQALYRMWPWVMGFAAPFVLGSVIIQTAQKSGLLPAIGAALFLAILIWFSYRIYRVFRPENSGPSGEHVRGAEIDDMTSEGDAK